MKSPQEEDPELSAMLLASGGSDEDDEDSEDRPMITAINPMSLPLKELQKLKSRFQDEEGNLIALTQDQFVKALLPRDSALSAKQPDGADESEHAQELSTLFKKIDASCTERVDWEDFTDYMLLHMPGGTGTDGACELSQNMPGADNYASGMISGHWDMINSIIVVNDVGTGLERTPGAGGGGGGGATAARRYITAGRDGFVKVWHTNLTLHRAIDVGTAAGNWLQQCCWMHKSRRLAVASSNFKIFFYDAGFGNAPVAHIQHKDGTPLCLGYHEASESDGREREMLMVGDNLGCVTVYAMDDDWMDSASLSEDGQVLKMKAARTKYHQQEWVTKVGYVSELQGGTMVTCGLDGSINLCDINHNQRKHGREAITLHKKGVHTWCWCQGYKFFASGGLDRHIIIWNPYTHKQMNILQGHNAAVLDVVVNEDQQQLISLSVDKVLKIWDLRKYRCIQTFTDKTEYKPEDRLTCMAFDPEGPTLVICSNNLNLLPLNVKEEQSRTHLAPIVGALYNADFRQIVSGDSSGTICVWDVRRGHLDLEFRRAHGDQRLTCMSFDESQRRLYTGAEDGVVKLWNFSSGAWLQIYTMKQPAEITRILWAKEGPNTFVVGLGWERIYIWPDSQKQTVEQFSTLEDHSGQGHTDDISCICRFSTGQLATGGDDGYVVFWKIQDASSASRKSRRYRLFDPSAGVAPQRPQPRPPAESRDSSRLAPRSGAFAPAGTSASQGKVHGYGALAAGKPPEKARGGATTPAGGAAAAVRARGSSFGAPSQSVWSGENADVSCMSQSDAPADDLFFMEDANYNGASLPAVRGMLFLSHMDCLLTSHTDRLMRVWSTTKAEFLQRLELLARVPDVDVASADADAPGESQGEDAAAIASAGTGEGDEGASSSRRRKSMTTDAEVVQSDEHGLLVRSQLAAVTALSVEKSENKWLLTGDSEGFVRLWDLAAFKPHDKSPARYLLRVQQFRPHRQAVTHLEHFELDGQSVVMSASVDLTIALSTYEGVRIGTFGGKSPRWHLSDPSGWCSTVPVFEDAPQNPEDDDGWGVNLPRFGAKGAGAQRRGGAGQASGPGAAGAGGRSQRSQGSRVGARQTATQTACGRGVFQQLSAVERFNFDFSVSSKEKQYLDSKLQNGRYNDPTL